MPSIERTFRDYDLGLLRGIASGLGLVLTSGNKDDAANELAEAMFDPETLEVLYESLPPDAQAGLSLLMQSEGKVKATVFDRRFGDLRPLGVGARDREQPWSHPSNPAEALYYRGVIGRAFFQQAEGSEEYVYIPDELVFFFEQVELPEVTVSATLTPIAPPASYISASSAIVDDITTVLAYLQREQPSALTSRHVRYLSSFLIKPEALDFIEDLMRMIDLVTATPFKPNSHNARPFLEVGRGPQLQQLINGWLNAAGYDDLARTPGLVVESGGPSRDHVRVRWQVLKWLGALEPYAWFALDDFVDYIHITEPDFMRPDGNYDALLVRDAENEDVFLSGFERWPRVEGALLRYLLTGPLHWLGMVDVSGPAVERPCFRVTEQVFRPVLDRRPLEIDAPESEIAVKADGHILATRAVNRYDRFQVARVAEWVLREERYLYRITARSLHEAGRRGVTAGQVGAFLRRVAPSLPSDLMESIERWGKIGSETRLAMMPVLTVKDAEMLESLRRVPAINALLGEQIGPRMVLVPQKHWEKLQDELMKIGIMVSVED